MKCCLTLLMQSPACFLYRRSARSNGLRGYRSSCGASSTHCWQQKVRGMCCSLPHAFRTLSWQSLPHCDIECTAIGPATLRLMSHYDNYVALSTSVTVLWRTLYICLCLPAEALSLNLLCLLQGVRICWVQQCGSSLQQQLPLWSGWCALGHWPPAHQQQGPRTPQQPSAWCGAWQQCVLPLPLPQLQPRQMCRWPA